MKKILNKPQKTTGQLFFGSDKQGFQILLGKNTHIIVIDDKGEIIFNPTNFSIPKGTKVSKLKDMKIIEKDNHFYIVEFENLKKNNRNLKIIRFSDCTELIKTIQPLEKDLKTGLISQRRFEKNLNVLINNLKNNNIPFCLVMMDIDNFKGINDTTGHANRR